MKKQKEKRKYVARPGIEPRTPDVESGALPIALRGLANMIQLEKTVIEIFADVNFVVCFLALKEIKVLLDHISSGLGLEKGHGTTFKKQQFRCSIVDLGPVVGN